jgi:hypothetical protein
VKDRRNADRVVRRHEIEGHEERRRDRGQLRNSGLDLRGSGAIQLADQRKPERAVVAPAPGEMERGHVIRAVFALALLCGPRRAEREERGARSRGISRRSAWRHSPVSLQVRMGRLKCRAACCI